MKRIAILTLCLAACGTPYQTARTTIFVGRAGMQFAENIFLRVQNGKMKVCAKLDTTSPAYAACMAPINKRRADYEKARRNVYDGLDTTEKLTDAAEKAKADPANFLTWIAPARAVVCWLDGLMNWLPKEAQNNFVVKAIRSLKVSFAGGCKK